MARSTFLGALRVFFASDWSACAGRVGGGADIGVGMALLGADGASGGCFADDGSVYPW